MSSGFQDGAKKVGGGARTGANDAGAAQPMAPMMMGSNPYGSGAGAGFGGASYGGGMGSNYGSMGPGGMSGAEAGGPSGKQSMMNSGAAMGGMNGMQSFGDMNNSLYGPSGGMGGGAFGPGGYAMGGSMYGTNSMYGQGMPEEDIVVTKIYSSRRDLGSMASGLDFPRRFDSYWPSYRSSDGNSNAGAPQSAYMNSLYGGGKNSMIDNASAKDRDLPAAGPTGADAEGNAAAAAATKAKTPETTPAKAPAKAPTPTSAKKAPTPTAAKARALPPAATGPTPEELARRETQRAAEEEERRRRGKAAAQALADEKAKQEALRAAEKEAADRQKRQQEDALKQKQQAQPPAKEEDDIPLARDDVAPPKQSPQQKPQKRPPTPQEAKKAPTPKAPVKAVTPQQQPKPKPESPQAQAKPSEKADRAPPPVQQTPVDERSERPKRPHSRPSRPVSRASSIDLVDFPKGDEVPDEMTEGGLSDPAKLALEHARAERAKEREAQRAARAQERARAEEEAKVREAAARQRREAKEADERRRRDEVARMDEERRRAHAAAVEAREREKEADKKRFEQSKAAEAEREAARVAALREERQRELTKDGGVEEDKPAPRSGSRPRSRRPQSRPASSLRGAIPEQPPDLEAGQIKDNMANELGKGGQSGKHGSTPLPTPVTVEARRPQPVTKAPSPQSRPTPKAQSPPTRATPSAAATGVTPHSVSSPATGAERHVAGSKSHESNPIRTLVVVEKMNVSNHAIQHTEKSLRWADQPTLAVTEVRERAQGNFDYRSEVVHKICDAATKGFNVAVLSSEAPNTVSRAQSAVWPILLRIVANVLRSKSNDQGHLQVGFQMRCALAYFDGTNAKDLFADEAQPFRQLSVRPSPVSGPHLVDMTYVDVTTTAEFETFLTNALTRADNDTVLATLSTGFIGAYLTVKEEIVIDGKKDVCISSINVTSAGSDITPYVDALDRTRGPYGTLLHLDVLGPCLTCFMYNVADDDSIQQSPVPGSSSVAQELFNTYQLLERMSKTDNLPMRSGSVRRFVHYIRENQREVRARIDANPDMEPEKRAKLEKYLRESESMFHEYVALLEGPVGFQREL